MKTFRFECQRDGVCCKTPGQMNARDLAKMAANFGVTKEKFWRDYCEMFERLSGARPKIGDNGYCIFYEPGEKGNCRIFDFAPYTCRQQPIKIGGKKQNLILISECAGFDKGPERDLQEWCERTGIQETIEFYQEMGIQSQIWANKHPEMAARYIRFLNGQLKSETAIAELRQSMEKLMKYVYRIGR